MTDVPQIRSMDQLVDYAASQVQRIQQMQDGLGALEGHGSSTSGRVQARTGPGGLLQDLRLDPTAMTLSATQLTAELREAISGAQQDYAAQAEAVMQPVLGAAPSAQQRDDLDSGLDRLDGLIEDLERVARQRGL